MKNVLRTGENAVKRLIEASGIGAAVILFVLMVLTVADVITRATFSHTIPGVVELTEMMMPCIGYLGIAWCALKGGHVSVDVIVGSLSERKRHLFDLLNYLMAAGISFLIGWHTLQQSLYQKGIGVRTSSLDVPKYPFMLVTSFAFFLLTIACLILLVPVVKRLVTR